MKERIINGIVNVERKLKGLMMEEKEKKGKKKKDDNKDDRRKKWIHDDLNWKEIKIR